MATISTRANFAPYHLRAARDHAQRCRRIESDDAALDWPAPTIVQLHALASSAVISSAAALEAYANEFFADAVDATRGGSPDLGQHDPHLLASLWPTAEKASILDKYDIALTACGLPPLDKGASPRQAAGSLVRLRNALVHFKHEWNNALREHDTLEKQLKGRFKSNQLWGKAPGRSTWFPWHCLGAGCASWAVATAEGVVTAFTERLSIPNRLADKWPGEP